MGHEVALADVGEVARPYDRPEFRLCGTEGALWNRTFRALTEGQLAIVILF